MAGKPVSPDTDLQEVILLHCESLSLQPLASHPYHSSALYNLAKALQKRFRETGSMTDLEEAILLHHESLSFRPIPHPNRYKSLIDLARALGDRFAKTGAMTDLDEAISMARESLSLSPHPHRLVVLKNLAYYLEVWCRENGSHSDFEELTSLRQEILAMSK